MQSRLAEVSRMYWEWADTRANSVALGFFACRPGRMRFHCAKKGSIETTRSFMTGRLGSDARSMRGESRSNGRVLQARRGTPLIAMAQVPHMPTRQAQRK